MNATDQIDYTRPFVENVQGTLYARFRLDADGVPLYDLWADPPVYYVYLYLHSGQSDRIDEVQYFQDDDPEPVAGSTDRDNDFPAFETCAGETLWTVRVRIGTRTYEQRAWLSQMLENGYPNPSPAVKSAILRIKVN